MKQFLGLSSGLCMMRAFLCHENGAWLNYMICRDELSLAMLFWEDMITLISMLEVSLFLCQYELLFESFGSEHSCHNKENYIENYVS